MAQGGIVPIVALNAEAHRHHHPETTEIIMAEVFTGSIIDLFSLLFGNETARAAFEDNPDKFLEEQGFGDLSCDDLTAVLPFVSENIETDQGADITFPQHSTPHGDEDDHEAVVRTIKEVVHFGEVNNITNITNINDNDFAVTNNVFADGDVDIDQDFNVASGEGAVAVDGDNSGDIVSGDRNVVGDNNEVVGDGSDNAFNEGSIVNGDQIATDGGAIANAGNNASASGSQDNDEDNDTTTTTTTTNNLDFEDNDTLTVEDNDPVTIEDNQLVVASEAGDGDLDIH